MRCLIGPVGQPIRQMTDRRTVMYTGKGACCFALLSRGAANRISADGAYHSVRPLHNTPSAASLSRFGLGHVRKHTPFALTLSSLHLGCSAKSLPKKHRFFGERPFCKGLGVQFWSGRDRKRHEETNPAGGGGIFAPLKLPDKSSAS